MRGAVSRAWRAVAANRSSSGPLSAARRREVMRPAAFHQALGSCRGFAEDKQSKKYKDFQQLRQQVNSASEECVELVKDWVNSGNKLTHENSTELFQSLVDRKLFKEALKVMDYTRYMSLVKPTPENCIAQLRLTCREFGVPSTERMFAKLPPAAKTEEVMAAFLTSLTKNKAAFKGVRWIKDLVPTSPELGAAIISVYSALNMHEKMLSTYSGLKERGVQPSLGNYMLMLKYKHRLGGGVGVLEGIEQEVKSVLRKTAIDDNTNVSTLGLAMETYALLGEADKVEEVWRIVEGLQVPLYDHFVSAMNSFGMLGNVARAEEVLKDFLEVKKKARPGSNPYFKMISIYAEQGMMDKAELMLDQMVNAEDRNFFPFNSLVAGYLAQGQTEIALQKLNLGYGERNVVPSYEVVLGLLPIFEERKDATSANKLIHYYLSKFAGDVVVYNNLLKVYVAASKKPADFLKKFNVEANEESKELLRKVAKFSN